MAPRKKIKPRGTFKFDKTADIGPQDYKTMEPEMAKVIHEERIRKQISSRRFPKT